MIGIVIPLFVRNVARPLTRRVYENNTPLIITMDYDGLFVPTFPTEIILFVSVAKVVSAPVNVRGHFRFKKLSVTRFP